MQVVNKKMCVIVILVLVIIESCTLFLMYKSFSNKNNTLDEVNLNINNANMFAIMLEQEDGTYKEDTTSTWPTSGYTYNASMSGCIDINGNKLDGVLTYDSTNNIATVDTGNTSYCYLYFSIPKWCNEDETASECLLRNPSSGLNNTTVEAGLYRYQGNSNNNDVVNNYVCFGTDNQTNCLNNKIKYMYRIIGISESGQLKLIKIEFLTDKIKWGDGTEWPDSLIFSGVNGSAFLENEIYVPTSWKNKISTMDWKYGDASSNGNYDGATIYAIEDDWTNTEPAKIGLMYLHDYYYSYAKGGSPESAENASKSWVFLYSDDGPEWTMTRYGSNVVFAIASSTVSYAGFGFAAWVRPVFYLTSDIKITGGSGKIDDPFIIS